METNGVTNGQSDRWMDIICLANLAGNKLFTNHFRGLGGATSQVCALQTKTFKLTDDLRPSSLVHLDIVKAVSYTHLTLPTNREV